MTEIKHLIAKLSTATLYAKYILEEYDKNPDVDTACEVVKYLKDLEKVRCDILETVCKPYP